MLERLQRRFAIDAVRTSREFIDFCTSDRHVAASLAASAIESDDESEELPEDFEVRECVAKGFFAWEWEVSERVTK